MDETLSAADAGLVSRQVQHILTPAKMNPGRAKPPTGRRPLTEQQLAYQNRFREVLPAASPGQVLGAYKKAAPILGHPSALVAFMDCLFAFTRPVDWQGRWRPYVWPSHFTLADQLGVSVRRVQQLVADALEAGLVLIRETGSGRRWGLRDGNLPDGRILDACGYDLSPLGQRQDEFDTIWATRLEERAEAKRLRAACSAWRRQVAALAELAQASEPDAEWNDLLRAVDADALPARRLNDPRALAPLEARLSRQHVRAEVLMAVKSLVNPVEIAPQGAMDCAPITTTSQIIKPKGSVKTEESSRPRAHEAQSNRQSYCGAQPPANTDVSLVSSRPGSSVLRGFIITPDLLARMAPLFRPWLRSGKPSWLNILEAADFMLSHLGISKHAWGQACLVFGRADACVVVGVISARYSAGKVRKPGSLLRKMVDLHLEGKLYLDKTLFGLLDSLPDRTPAS